MEKSEEKSAAVEVDETTAEVEESTAETPLKPSVEKTSEIIEIASASPSTNAPRPIDIQFSNVFFSVPLKKGKWKEILHDVSGEFRAGRLTAILGPSGAGKTTLLNLIASRRNDCKLNGDREQLEPARRESVCYVPQEFDLMPLLSVRETIYFAARLKLTAKGHDEASRHAIIKDAAERLSLLSCMETLACNLSGGEKKRLSIAVEMIASPSLLLLDEPTSGLDSASSNQVISLLSFMARQGCTIACTVHQPSSRMALSFDDLMLMCRGHCVYCGPRDKVLEHFEASGYVCPPFYNLCEFLLEVMTGERGGDFELMWKKDDSAEDKLSKASSTQSSSEEIRRPKRHYAASHWEQQKILLQRAFICVSRDNLLTKLRLAAHLVVAVLLGLIFYEFGEDASKVQSNIACIFFFTIFLYFATSIPAVQLFPPEAKVFLRENTNSWYSLESYYITKVLSDLPIQIVCPTGFLLIAYYMTGQPLEWSRFLQAWLICLLITILAQSFGIATGAAFNFDIGIFLIPALNIPMFLFAGFFIKLNEIPIYLRFISDISYFRYAFEGLLLAIYSDRSKIPCGADFCYLRTPDRILGELDMPSVPFCATVGALGAWIVCLHLLIYGVLSYRQRAKIYR